MSETPHQPEEGEPSDSAAALAGLRVPPLTLTDDDYPALFVMADEASKRGQERFVLLSRLELIFVILAAGLGALISFLAFAGANVAGTRAVAAVSGALLIGAALIRAVSRSTQPTAKWFDGRVVAESTKSLAWRYMTHVEPFNVTTSQSDVLFVDALREVLGERTLGTPTPRQRTSGLQQITAPMHQIRSLSFHQRRSAYDELRLRDQLSWYTTKSATLRRSNDRWFVAGIAFEILALGSAMVLIAFPTGPNLIGIFASATAAATTFSRLRGDSEVADRYALAAQELSMIRLRLQASNEHTFSDAVKDAEAAISREHKIWAAKRS
jgi:hypothetical protein